MKKEKLRAKKRKNHGFSLIEVLLAIVILGLVATPILQIFITSAQINNRSREMMAATDVATITMEYLSSMRMDVDDGIRDSFQKAENCLRVPGLSYTATASNLGTNYSALSTFCSKMIVDENNHQNKCVYYNETNADSGVFGMALNAVEHNNYVFDVIVWFEPATSAASSDFFTYDVTVEVYNTTLGDIVDPSNPSATIETTLHYAERLVVLNGAVMNE